MPTKPAAPPVADDDARTVVLSVPKAGSAPAEADRTIVGPAAGREPSEAERTVIRPVTPTAAAAAPTGPADHELVALSGTQRGRHYPIVGAEALVGSNPTCNIVIPGLEGVHAKVSKRDGGYEIQNLGAAGSLIAGKRRATTATLRSGDLLKLGDTVLRFAQIGEMFSSHYSEADLQSSGLGAVLSPQVLKENRLYLIFGSVVVLLLLALLWPSQTKRVVVQQKQSSGDEGRQKEVEGLLASGEVLFNTGKLVAPPDQPDADNAYAKFNDVLALDPGNEKAKDWLKKIDAELDKARRARDEEQKRKQAEDQARRDRQRADLDRKVNAIIEEGDEYFGKGEVTEPVGTNALAKYREALKVDPESTIAQQRVQKAAYYYVQKGDELRDKDDWSALEDYRKAERATDGKDEEIERRVHELEAKLKSGFAGTNVRLVIYRDDRGQQVVLDDLDKVPARYKDRALVVDPLPPKR
jgi:tetratricopeptide (TPR) repeat protein